MLIKVLRSKIHRAHVTATHLEYEGSITIDENLMDAVGLTEGMAVLVADVTNGSRQETYAMKGKRGSGIIQMNGASARLVAPGDIVIIMGFAYATEDEIADHKPRKVYVNEKNRIVRKK
jgi:aspartate 1-decarboxylase